MSDKQGLTVAKAGLVALIVESLFFGTFTILYVISSWILLGIPRPQRQTFLKTALFLSSTLIWSLSLGHLALDAQRATIAFVDNAGTPNGAFVFLSSLNHPTHVAKNVIFITTTIIGDVFVTYRLWIVWNRTWWIPALPMILIVGTIVGGYATCYGLTHTSTSSSIQSWILSFLSLSVTVNVVCTVLIAARIFRSSRRARAGSMTVGAAQAQWDALEALVQSAALYSAALVALLAVYVRGSNAQYVCLDLLQPLVGVTFTSIVIRVGVGHSLDSPVGAEAEPSRRTARLSTGGTEFPPFRPVAINVSVGRAHGGPSVDSLDRKDEMDSDQGKGDA